MMYQKLDKLSAKMTAILLMGPTATGKTNLGLMLAQDYPIEIISVDSALIYQDMNIGTAKPTIDELNLVPHHLINIMTPLEKYSVAEFIQDATKLIEETHKRGKIPILIGGTMMYYNGLINGISVLPSGDLKVRNEIENKALRIGWNQLHKELINIDPIAAAKINPNDKQRISRALEVYYLTGQTISQLQVDKKLNPAKHIKFIPLSIIPDKREILHKRIEERFINMLNNGFIEEVKALQMKYPDLNINHTSMRSVGYFQVWQYLEGKISLNELKDQGIFATRQLAKRQITWLRNLTTINIANDDLELNYMLNKLIKHINL